MTTDIRTIEEFLYTEADLLDATDLEQWMTLYSNDGCYWMPIRQEQTDPLGEISILYENKTLMAIRCNNFGHRLAPSMEYPVRCSHIISRVKVLEPESTDGVITVTSNFQAAVFYREQTIYAGRYTHKLVLDGDSFKILQKRVDLINADANHKSLLIYI